MLPRHFCFVVEKLEGHEGEGVNSLQACLTKLHAQRVVGRRSDIISSFADVSMALVNEKRLEAGNIVFDVLKRIRHRIDSGKHRFIQTAEIPGQ
eukprot:COSAG03_NODE_2925_length_2351_cov_2.269094_3_plen_94_part_00